MIRVGLLGATGYMGGEALRVLLEHPEVDIVWATSRKAGRIEDYHPNLYGCNVKLIHPDDITACDVVFTALPTESTLAMVPPLLAMGSRLIDLGAAFRLKDKRTWEKVYQTEHNQWPLAEESVYGLSELHQSDIEKARLIANPGCFSSAAILAMAPLVKDNRVDLQRLVVNGISGTAGAGAELARAAHHPEIGNNLVAYNVVDHRHSYEMEQELSLLCGSDVAVHFTPVYAPITRGILSICHGFPTRPVTRDELLQHYRDFYAGHPFVRVYDVAKEAGAAWQYRPYPWVSAVAGSNYCFIGLDVDEIRGRVVVFSVLDSLGKGGAQVGVENMNLMFKLDRTLGLVPRGRHPA